jgi:large subunit ribosomal protein L17
LKRNLSIALIEHGRITTTVAKAKELRPFIEKLVTLARSGTLHARRLVLSRLPDKAAVAKLFNEIGPRFADRPGGYTRILKRHERRLGDAGETAIIEFLKADEKVEARGTPVAPTVKD